MNMPEMPKSYKAWKPGYRVDVHYDEEKMRNYGNLNSSGQCGS